MNCKNFSTRELKKESMDGLKEVDKILPLRMAIYKHGFFGISEKF